MYLFLSILQRCSFSFFSFFCFFCILLLFACLFVCFNKWKIYILIHIQLHGRVSDQKISTWLISGNKTTFFGLKFRIWKSNCIVCWCASPPSAVEGGGEGEGGRTSNQIFKKGGLDRTLTFRVGVAGNEGGDFFHRGCSIFT